MKNTDHIEQIKQYTFRLRYLAESTFDMGSNNIKDVLWRESPIHKVKLSAYYIGEYPVTQELWKAVMGNENNPSSFVGDQRPVERVSWDDIVGTTEQKGFLHYLNEMTKDSCPDGFIYRLPTEAEWEYAARAGKDYEYAGSNKLKEVAWFGKNSHQESKNVGQKKANDFGLFDMSGNVWEWCHDMLSEDFYQECVDEAKRLGQEYTLNPCNLKGNDFDSRVFRGCAWSTTPRYCRVSYRDYRPPSFRDYGIGFRLVLSSFSLGA